MAKHPRQDLTKGNVLKSLIKFSFPLILANLLQTLYNMLDMIVAGRYIGSAAMSAVSVGGQTSFFLITFSIGLGAGGQILIAHLRGEEDEEGLRELTGTFFTMSAIAGISVSVLGVLVSEPVLKLLDTPEKAYGQAVWYMRITCAGMLFAFGYNSIAAVFRGLGDSKRPFIFILAAFVSNMALNYIFVPLMGMGAEGTALATVISQAVSFFTAAIYLYRHRASYALELTLRSFKIRKDRLLKLLKIGVPFGIQMSVINLSNMFITAGINSFGVSASAVLGAGTKITHLFTVPMMAVGNGASTVVGQNIGAGETKRAERAVHSALLCMVALTGLTLAITQFLPENLIELFNGDPGVLETGVLYLRIVSWGYLGYALHSAYNAAVLGVGFTMFSLLAALAEAVLGRIFLTWLLLQMSGLTGIFIAQAAAPYISAIILCVYFYSGRWKRRKRTV